MYTSIHICIKYTCTLTDAHYTKTYTHTHAHMYKDTCAYTHTHTHTHTGHVALRYQDII